MLSHVVHLYLEVDQNKLPCSLFAYGIFFLGSTVLCMPFPANTSVICIKFVIEVKFLCSSFENTFIFVVLAYFSDCIFVNSLISVVISFAVLILYQDKFA